MAGVGNGEGAKDKGVAILDYALGNRPSTGVGGSGRPAVSPTRPAPVGSRRGVIPKKARDHSAEDQNCGVKALPGPRQQSSMHRSRMRAR